MCSDSINNLFLKCLLWACICTFADLPYVLFAFSFEGTDPRKSNQSLAPGTRPMVPSVSRLALDLQSAVCISMSAADTVGNSGVSQVITSSLIIRFPADTTTKLPIFS